MKMMNRTPYHPNHPTPQKDTRHRHRGGFTLVELMVVIVILGLLAGFVGHNVVQNIEKARIATTRSQIKELEAAVINFKIDTGVYPEDLIDLIEEPAGVSGWNPDGYLQNSSELPTDAWGHEYYYEYPGNFAKFDIWSYGADDQEGGEGEEADIYNSDVEAVSDESE